MRRAYWWLMLAMFLVGAGLGCARLEAKPSDRVQKGQTYIVIWEYEQGLAVREVLIIDAVNSDGWVRARNPGDARVWEMNLNRAIGLVRFDPATMRLGPQRDPEERHRASL
ncbi:MAG TPA: hypothetical protein VEA69_01370 [Tepidisphaeraceae bacterium]|nr:hypothetical protein [Tepidisphaeraceae bacterium]